MRDDGGVRCDVAREALSARLDGERQHVPTHRVDTHLESCPDCRAWLLAAAAQASRFASVDLVAGPDLAERIIAAAGVEPAPPRRGLWRWVASRFARCGLVTIGALLVLVAVAQFGGVDFGMVSAATQGPMSGVHLLHESTAWTLALGLGMIAAGLWTTAAPGVAAVLAVYVGVLAGYVIGDALAGEVTATRILSHVPVLVGLVFALLAVRDSRAPRRWARTDTAGEDIVLPAGAKRGRRRGHLWPIGRRAA